VTEHTTGSDTEDGGATCEICGERFESTAALADHVHSIGIVD
jgi:hypothetical protein